MNDMGAACANHDQAVQAGRTMAVTTNARRDSTSFMFVSCDRRLPFAGRYPLRLALGLTAFRIRYIVGLDEALEPLPAHFGSPLF